MKKNIILVSAITGSIISGFILGKFKSDQTHLATIEKLKKMSAQGKEPLREECDITKVDGEELSGLQKQVAKSLVKTLGTAGVKLPRGLDKNFEGTILKGFNKYQQEIEKKQLEADLAKNFNVEKFPLMSKFVEDPNQAEKYFPNIDIAHYLERYVQEDLDSTLQQLEKLPAIPKFIPPKGFIMKGNIHYFAGEHAGKMSQIILDPKFKVEGNKTLITNMKFTITYENKEKYETEIENPHDSLFQGIVKKVPYTLFVIDKKISIQFKKLGETVGIYYEDSVPKGVIIF